MHLEAFEHFGRSLTMLERPKSVLVGQRRAAKTRTTMQTRLTMVILECAGPVCNVSFAFVRLCAATNNKLSSRVGSHAATRETVTTHDRMNSKEEILVVLYRRTK